MDVPAGVNPSPIRSYLSFVQRRLGVIIVVVVVFTGLAVAYTARQPSVYQATSRVLLQGTLAEQIVAGQSNNLAFLANDPGETELQVMQSPVIEDAVARKLGHNPAVSVARIGTSTIVVITASSGNKVLAARDATTYAHVYVKVRKQQQLDQLVEVSNQFQAKVTALDGQLAKVQAPLDKIEAQIAASTDPAAPARLQGRRQALEQRLTPEINSITSRRTTYSDQLDRLQLALSATVTGGAQVVADAVAPSTPVEPRPFHTGAIAFGIALVIGIGLALLLEQLDDSIRSKTQLELLTGLATVGLIPSVRSWRRGKAHEVVQAGAENSSAAEAYRSLRTAVQFIGVERPAQVIQITSAMPSEGKTTTAANLALALARGGKRVVLVDCDLRRPRLHELFDLPGERGLTMVLLHEIALSEAIQSVAEERQLALLSSGEVPPNPVELITAGGFANIISTLRAEADYVIVDTPPILPVADARVISALVDVTLLVVAANSSAEKDIRRSTELLAQVDARVVGTVLNNIPSRGRYSLSYGYWYSYGSRPLRKRRRRAVRPTDLTRPQPKVDA
ncbi:MAG: polysaccharide biosynthesis tyrosine autokinase [Actinomycetota bacterium]|nr:polysaccharide biosynthesis tyrosine autokinase [Actinomycetota bacterium]